MIVPSYPLSSKCPYDLDPIIEKPRRLAENDTTNKETFVKSTAGRAMCA